jgi:ABC-type transport system involved in multi-copper enzyme maturation permease subunit
VTPVTAALGVDTGLMNGFGRTVFIPTLGVVTVFVALGLGTICAIQEFTDKTAHFLFTKPRSRKYFVWAGWAVGCAEYSAIVLANIFAGWLTLYHYGKGPFKLALIGEVKIQNIAAVFISGLVIFSLTYAFTAALRNGLKGLGASMGTLMIFQSVIVGVHLRWNVDLDQLVWKLSPTIRDVGWILLALLLVFATQLVIDRAEI